MHGITVSQLKSWNNLRSDLIHPGNVLVVAKGETATSIPKQPSNSDTDTQAKVKTYVVKNGDSLYSVAKKFGVSISNLRKWNEMTSNTLYVGYTLIVNKAQPTAPIIQIEDQGKQYRENQSIKHTPYEYNYHIVQEGDSLETISWQHEVKLSELKKLNNLSSSNIKIGQKIIISKVPTQEKVNIEPTEVTNANVERLLDIARSYLGVTKYSPEHRALVDAYNRIYPKPVGYSLTYDDDWCDAFVTHIADEAGLSRLTGREVGVERHKNIVKNKGVWMGLTKPKAGDLIFYNWDGYRNGWGHHIGIVESYNNGLITTLEGNTRINDSKLMVARKEFAWDSIYIQGYGRPRY
ncbi:LysM peptidoglycan-binding domain-containing protein [Facklamia sp. 7083-14-GEN3]|nr:LysM peptidoglycan-binding domain-containing protein [Facklamia sp. 7083-14-GEN3]